VPGTAKGTHTFQQNKRPGFLYKLSQNLSGINDWKSNDYRDCQHPLLVKVSLSLQAVKPDVTLLQILINEIRRNV